MCPLTLLRQSRSHCEVLKMNSLLCCAEVQNTIRVGSPPSVLEEALGLLKNGALCDIGRNAEMTPYKDISETGASAVAVIIWKCLVEYDFNRLFTRHSATLKTFDATYQLRSDEEERRFPDAVHKLGCDLKALPLLAYLKVVAVGRSCIPASFPQNIGRCGDLRTLLLQCTTLDFGYTPLGCARLERLSFFETTPMITGDSVVQSLNLSNLHRLKAVRVCARRPLILPVDNSALVALDIRGVVELKHHESLELQILRATDCQFSMIEPLILQSENLRQLTITFTSRTDLKNFSVDATRMDYLSLTNIVMESIFSSAEKPLTALFLYNVELVGTMARDDLIYTKSLCLAYNDRCRPSPIMMRIGPTALKSLVFGREHQWAAQLTGLDDEAMTALIRVKDSLEVFATFAPIKELPRMPKLKCLGLYSEELLLLNPPMPGGLHLGLRRSPMNYQTPSSNVPAQNLFEKGVATLAYYSSEYGFWEAMNQRTDIMDFMTYSFDWTYLPS